VWTTNASAVQDVQLRPLHVQFEEIRPGDLGDVIQALRRESVLLHHLRQVLQVLKPIQQGGIRLQQRRGHREVALVESARRPVADRIGQIGPGLTGHRVQPVALGRHAFEAEHAGDAGLDERIVDLGTEVHGADIDDLNLAERREDFEDVEHALGG
jgi:hypothetical protein